MDFDQDNDIKINQLNTIKDITHKINVLYYSYNNSRSKESLMELINIIIENIHTPNIRDFLELKIDNETILFEKFDNNKLVIEYLFENDMVSDIERIKYHPEIIDYIEKYKKLSFTTISKRNIGSKKR